MPSAARNAFSPDTMRLGRNQAMVASRSVFQEVASSGWSQLIQNDINGLITAEVLVCNKTSSDGWFSLAVVTTSQVAGGLTDYSDFVIYHQCELLAGETFVVPLLLNLNPDQILAAKASDADRINAWVNYCQDQ